jgi:hypothetical protein
MMPGFMYFVLQLVQPPVYMRLWRVAWLGSERYARAATSCLIALESKLSALA